MADITERFEDYIRQAGNYGLKVVDSDDLVEAQQTIVALREQVRHADVRFDSFKNELRALVHKLREAIDDERREANSEIERLDNRLEIYRIALQEATNEIGRLRRENDSF